jgi:Ca2+-binding RTX toxin-like protein
MIKFGTRRSGTEHIDGSSADDILSGYFPGEESTDTSVDHIHGYAGYDNLFGGLGDDWLYGGADDDNLTGGPGADHLYGGYADHDSGDHDCALYNSSPAGVTINLMSGSGHGGDAEGDVLSGIEDVIGSDFGDHIFGNDVANALEGRDGQDVLYGAGGRDLLYGDGGDDRLEGGAGADTLYGGPGTDRATYEVSTAGVTVSLASGHGYGGEAEGDLLFEIEDLYGSERNDALIGNAGNNSIWGGNGNDNIKGGDGSDHLYGGVGDDRLDGGGNSSVSLYPFAVGDELEGQGGSDTFVWSRITDTGVTPSAMDHIVDFFPLGQGRDHIDLNTIDADERDLGKYQGFTFIGNLDFSEPGQVRWASAGDAWTFIISLNTDTDLEPEAAIRVTTVGYDHGSITVTPDASWFVPWVADHPL